MDAATAQIDTMASPETPSTQHHGPQIPQTIMERRGFARLSLQRSQSSPTATIASINPTDSLSPNTLQLAAVDTPTRDLVKNDIKLLTQVQNESVLSTPSLERSGFLTPSPYVDWQCEFKFTPTTPAASTPTTPSGSYFSETNQGFLRTVRKELTKISTIKAGLRTYLAKINSGEHAVFPASFLIKQDHNTQVTIRQLEKIREHLEEVEVELGSIEDESKESDGVKVELLEAFEHAKPWIARTRAIMVHSHVWYKTNYALAADVKRGAK